MREEGHTILGFEPASARQRFVDIAVITQPTVLVFIGYRCNDAIHHGLCAAWVAGLSPIALHSLDSLEGAPGVIGNHGNTAG